MFKSHKRKPCLPERLRSIIIQVNESIKLCDSWEEESKSSFIFGEMYGSNLFKSCNSSCAQYQYIGQRTFSKGTNDKANEVFIGYTFPSNEVQVFEEYLMFGVNDLIGTIGGHSGLFIGFSFYGFVSEILGYIQKKLLQ